MTTVSRELDSVIHEIACVELSDEQPIFQSDPIMARFKEKGTEIWVDTVKSMLSIDFGYYLIDLYDTGVLLLKTPP